MAPCPIPIPSSSPRARFCRPIVSLLPISTPTPSSPPRKRGRHPILQLHRMRTYIRRTVEQRLPVPPNVVRAHPGHGLRVRRVVSRDELVKLSVELRALHRLVRVGRLAAAPLHEGAHGAVVEQLAGGVAVRLVELALLARAALLDVVGARPAHAQDPAQPVAFAARAAQRRIDSRFCGPDGHGDRLGGHGAVVARGLLGERLLEDAEGGARVGRRLEDEHAGRVVDPFEPEEVGVEVRHVCEDAGGGEEGDGAAFEEDRVVSVLRVCSSE